MLEGGYDRWLQSYALVNFMDEDLTAVVPTKTLIQRDASVRQGWKVVGCPVGRQKKIEGCLYYACQVSFV